MKKITEGNWRAHVLNFIIKGITNYRLKKKKSIDGCLCTLMIIYFHLAKNKDKKGEENSGLPWVSNWNRKQLGIVKMAETKKKLKEMKKKEKKEEKKKKPSSSFESDPSETEVDFSFESESEEDSEEPRRKQPKRTAKKTQSKKKHIIEDSSSEEEIHSYDGMSEVNLANETDPLFQGQTDQSSVNKPSDCIIPIQLCLPSSKTALASPVPPFEPSSQQRALHNPRKLMKAHQRCHQLYLKCKFNIIEFDTS
ncbi:hypothetical protein Ahy_A01g004854 [Arachis hypogaea]|uniref:Uncharacterized protein n=1 Tax=Arachis hypogaea TaxID=3818 RepID=A0A445EXD4_ARAHY|nr:hypothetical protein Ahy_A01g004854 [Arachis hypogaea]